MESVDFPGTNVKLVPAEGNEDSVNSIMAQREQNAKGETIAYTVAFKPTPGELAALNLGWPIFIRTAGSQFAPICVYTKDEEKEVPDGA